MSLHVFLSLSIFSLFYQMTIRDVYIYIPNERRRRPIKYSLPWMMMLVYNMKIRRRICKISNSIVFERHLSKDFFCFESIQSEKLSFVCIYFLENQDNGWIQFSNSRRERISIVKYFSSHSILNMILLSYVQQTVMYVFDSLFDKCQNFLLRSLRIKHTFGKFGH